MARSIFLILSMVMISAVANAQEAPASMFGYTIGRAVNTASKALEETTLGDVFQEKKPHPILGDNATLSVYLTPMTKRVAMVTLSARYKSGTTAEINYNAIVKAVCAAYGFPRASFTEEKWRGDISIFKGRGENHITVGRSYSIDLSDYSVSISLGSTNLVNAAKDEAAQRKLNGASK